MSHRIRLTILAFTAGLLPLPAQSVGGCPVFPSNNVWNTRVDDLPLDANSAAYINTIGSAKYLHPDFSASGGGIPFVIVPGTQPKVPVIFGDGAAESEPGPYPIPRNAPIEAASDRHVLVVDSGNCILYELYAAYPQPDGSWQASSGAVFDLKSNQLRPAGWTSADAAGLPILPGLVRYDEVISGVINHALRITAPKTRREYIWPARHRASALTGKQYPPMGQRFRLKASFDISGFSRNVQVILTALKQYGAILADNGSSWYLTGEADPRWDDDEMHTLHKVLGGNMEVVDQSALMVSPDSAETRVGASTVQRVTLNPASLASRARSTSNSVTLSVAAPTGGVTVFLSSSNPAAASVPASILIGAGATAGSFAIEAGTVSTATTATITAFALGVSRTATLTITPSSGIASVTAAPAAIAGGATSTGTVKLTSPASSGGAIVTLASSDAAAAKVPASVTVSAGAFSATFPITTFAQQQGPIPVTITASHNGSAASATITVTEEPSEGTTVSSVVLTPATLQGGSTASGYIYISAPAGAAGMPVSLSSSNPSVVHLPATITVKPGHNYAYLAISSAPVAAKTAITIAATAGRVTRSAVMTVQPAGIIALTLNPTAVTGGASVNGTVTLGGISAAGMPISITSALPGIVSVPASVTVPVGKKAVSFPIKTARVSAATSVKITIRSGTSTVTATLAVHR